LKCLKLFEINWSSEEVDEKLKGIMFIHASWNMVSDSSGYVDYVKDKHCWFVKVVGC
jgi:hypothetical protein